MDPLRNLKNNPLSIINIKNPSEEMQAVAVKGNPFALHLLLQRKIIPSEFVQLTAVMHTGYALGYLISFDIEVSNTVILTAIQNWPDAIMFVKNPSRIMQLTAVKTNPSSYEYIKNPDPLVSEYMKKI